MSGEKLTPLVEQTGGKYSDGAPGAHATTTETPRSDDPGVLSKDVVYQTLSNRRRRFVLQALLANDHLTVRELTAYVAARECGVPVPALEYKQRKRVYTSLVQTHLPTMHRDGVVDYDKSRGTVESTAAVDTFEQYLDEAVSTPSGQSAWSGRYLGLAAAFGVLLVAVWAGVAPFQSVPPMAYAAAFAFVLGVTAGFHRRWERRAGGGGLQTVDSSGDVASTTAK